MKLLLLFLVIFIIFRREYQVIQLKDFECNLNANKIYENSTCFTKSLDKNATSLTLKLWSKKPLNSIIISAKLSYKYETVFREILHMPAIDWCRFIGTNTPANRLFWIAIELAKGIDKSLLHACPYFDFIYDDVRIPLNKMISIFPTGDYKLQIQIIGSDEEDIMKANVTYSVLPSAKKN